MRDEILYVPQGILLDLSRPDLGHPEGRAILRRHYRQGGKARPEFSRQAPAFTCMRHHEGTNPGLFLKRIRDQWWAVHYDRSAACGSLRVPEPMSDEHRRQLEYWARAAEDAGWHVDTAPGRARPDALITGGPVRTGIEVQRHAMSAKAACDRSARAGGSGILDVWFSNRDPAPAWVNRVPSVTEARLPWDVLPARGSALATGLRVIAPARCSPGNFHRCPEAGGRQCGRYHPKDEPWRRMLVDDVAAQVPAGQIVPMRFRRGSRGSDVFLVPPSSLALYQELTGRSGSYSPAAELARRPAAVACRSDQPGGRSAARCCRCRVSPAGPGGVLCSLCRLDIEATSGYLAS